MGLVDKPSFSAGEIDPTLWERTNLDKYRAGLATARNWIVSKTGSILTRQGRSNMWQTKLLNRSVVGYSPPGGGVVLEWGHLYVRIYSLATFEVLADVAHPFLESDIPNLHFDTSGSFVYIFCVGKNVLKLNYSVGGFLEEDLIYALPPPPISAANTASGTPSGYAVDYAITYTLSGEESLPFYLSGSFALPISTSQQNSIGSALFPVDPGATNPNPFISFMSVYRRPKNGGAFGFIGSTTQFGTSGGDITGTLLDVGQDADYTHQPPASLLPNNPAVAPPNTQSPAVPLDPGTLLSNTGIIYQQRLLITDSQTDLEAIYASQPGFQDNFYENFPIDNASALKFKCGTSGYARVLRLLDSDGLVAFTAAGVYLNQGELGPANITMQKKGRWIINPSLPPLAIPGGVMFLDAMTNGIRNLLWSFQLNAFDADEVSLYSNHLFRTRQLSTWNFQVGVFPLLWIVFNDGTFASFTYEYNQQMQAWTRHDSNEVLSVRSCAGTTNADQTFFVVSKTDALGNVTRYFEMTIPRYVPQIDIATDPDWDKNPSAAYMDSVTTYRPMLNLDLVAGDSLVFSTSQLEDWTQPLRLSCTSSGVFGSFDVQVGNLLRFFDDNGSQIDFEVTTVENDNSVIVEMTNNDVFNPKWVSGRQIYLCATTFTGLDYMDGENVCVMADGGVVASPNNDVDGYPTITVLNGSITIPIPGAIVHVGRPIIGDIQGLPIDTVEQAPTLVESITVNKIYVKVKDSKGLFIGNNFPIEQIDPDSGLVLVSGDGVTGMTYLDNFPVDYTRDFPIIGNRAQPSQIRRYETTMAGDYASQGMICIRQVDPVHAEILSIIPDVEVLKRSDR